MVWALAQPAALSRNRYSYLLEKVSISGRCSATVAGRRLSADGPLRYSHVATHWQLSRDADIVRLWGRRCPTTACGIFDGRGNGLEERKPPSDITLMQAQNL